MRSRGSSLASSQGTGAAASHQQREKARSRGSSRVAVGGRPGQLPAAYLEQRNGAKCSALFAELPGLNYCRSTSPQRDASPAPASRADRKMRP